MTEARSESRAEAQSDEELVRRTAALARLEVTPEEVARLAPQFARILAAFETLAALDVAGAESMERAGRGEPCCRADEERPSPGAEAVLRNAPAREGDFFSVPKTIGGEG